MPIYEYECPKCQSTIDIQQRMTEEALKDFPCHICWVDGQEVKMRRVISKSSFQLKGTGWYSSGYHS
jgi:putative FmdB family regulatory protein